MWIISTQGHIYSNGGNICAAFLANYDEKISMTVTYNGKSYYLPAWSVSILPDCKTVVYNTAKVIYCAINNVVV